jgi:hypothetical protein
VAFFSRWTAPAAGCIFSAFPNLIFPRMPRRFFDLIQWRPNPRSGQFWFVVAGAIFVIAACVVLRKMEHPWEGVTAKRVRDGRPLDASDLGRIYGFWFGLVATIVTGLAALTSRWWWRAANPGPQPEIVPVRRFGGRVWLILALLLTLATWLGARHLDRPVRRDEQDTLRFHIHGYYAPDSVTGELEFIEATWPDAFFGNQHGNNPVLLSVAAKTSLSLWQKVTGLPEDHFSNVAIRLPGYLACGLAVLAMAWCVRGMASAGAAALGAALLMCHPAFVEYSLQARGYVFVMLGVPLALGAAVRALDGGGWRHWSLLVAACAMMLYAYLGSVFFVAPLAATVLAIIVWRAWRSRKSGDPAPRRDLIRLMVTGTIGVSLYLTAAMPPLMSFWINRENFPWLFHADAHWWLSLVTEYAGGRIFKYPVTPEDNHLPIGETILILMRDFPLVWIGMALVIALVASGLVRVWRDRQRRDMAILLSVAFLSPFLQIAVHAWVTHMLLFAYYLLYWLPVVLCLAALGMDAWCRAITAKMGSDRAGRTAAIGLMAAYYVTTGIGGMGYLWEEPYIMTKPEVFARGDQHWIIYPEERMLKLSNTLPVPETFPEGVAFPPPRKGEPGR